MICREGQQYNTEIKHATHLVIQQLPKRPRNAPDEIAGRPSPQGERAFKASGSGHDGLASRRPFTAQQPPSDPTSRCWSRGKMPLEKSSRGAWETR